MLHSAISGSDKLERFTETGANSGSLGIFPAKFLIRLMLRVRCHHDRARLYFNFRCFEACQRRPFHGNI
jgi:hypothetical protein